MEDTAQALGNLVVETISKEQAARLLGKQPAQKKAPEKPARKIATEKKTDSSPSRALVALSSQSETEFAVEDPAASSSSRAF